MTAAPAPEVTDTDAQPISLRIEDSQESKFDLAMRCAARPDLLTPTYIISSRRSQDLRTIQTIPQLAELATIVVSEEEEADYVKNQPTIKNLVTIPRGYRGLAGGAGRARQFCLDRAMALGQEHIIIMDDDLVTLTIQYGLPGDNNKSSTAWTDRIADDPESFRFGLFIAAGLCADDAFEAQPRAVLAGTVARNAVEWSKATSRTRWDMNRYGRAPMQMVSWHVDRFNDMVGEIDLAAFNNHGEDLSSALYVLQAGGDIVRIPSISTGFLPMTDSVIRTNRKVANVLRHQEYNSLRTIPYHKYVATKFSEDGRPLGSRIAWRRLRQDDAIAMDLVKWED